MARRKSKEEKEYDVLLANVREVSKSRAGKEFIWYVLSAAGIYGEPFTGDNRTFYNEGRRSLGLQLLQLLDDADLSIYPRLLLDKRKVDLDEGGRDGPEPTDTGIDGADIDSDTGTVPRNN
jgi:hypothetical protein